MARLSKRNGNIIAIRKNPETLKKYYLYDRGWVFISHGPRGGHVKQVYKDLEKTVRSKMTLEEFEAFALRKNYTVIEPVEN